MLGNILAVGLMSMGMGLSGVKDEPQKYLENESTYTITYENADDWKQRAQSIYTWLNTEGYTNSNKLTITATFTYDNTAREMTSIYIENNNIVLNSGSRYPTYKLTEEKWVNPSNADAEITFNSLAITSQTYYEGNQEPSMGSDIVGTIASGMGIIGALATEFLAGFTNLFYSAGNLTPFAIFSLVFLGIAVSFAVVKLVLSLIRSNTGA